MEFLNGYQPSQLDEKFFSLVIRKICPGATLIGFKHVEVDSSDSILSALAEASTQERKSKNFIGFSRFQLAYKDHNLKYRKNIVIKSKPPSAFIKNVVLDLAKPAGQEMEAMFAEHVDTIIPGHVDHNEIEMYNLDFQCIRAICPEVYLTFKDTSQDIYFIVMEDLTEGFELNNTISAVEDWSDKDFADTLEGLAAFHAHFMGRTHLIPHHLKQWLPSRVTLKTMLKKKPFLQMLLDHNCRNSAELYSPELYSLLTRAVAKSEAIYSILYNLPYTLIHDDVHPRNLCMRKVPTVNHQRLCLYDWEVVRESINLRDVVDFLATTLPEKATPDMWMKYRDVYYKTLLKSLKECDNWTEEIQLFMGKDNFYLVFDLCVVDCLIDKYGFYMFSHVYRPHGFFVRIIKNIIAYVLSIQDILLQFLQ